MRIKLETIGVEIASSIWDTDLDTGIEVERNTDDDTIRFHVGGITNYATFDATDGAFFNTNDDALPFRVATTGDTHALYNDGTNDTWAVGTSQSEFTINAITVKPKMVVDRAGGDSNINFACLSNLDTASAGAFMVWLRARGSGVGPTTYQAVQNLDRLGTFRCDAHDGTEFLTVGDFAFSADDTVSTGIVPTSFTVRQMDNTGTLFTSFSIASNGRLFFDPLGGTSITLFPEGGIRANQNQESSALADFIYYTTNYSNGVRIDVSANQFNVANSANQQGGLLSADIDDGEVVINKFNTDENLVVESSSAGVNLWETDTTNDLIDHNGGLRVKTTRVTSGPYTIGYNEHEIFVDTDSAAITVNLPAGVDGQRYRIINCGTGTNDVTITPDGSELLLGVNSSDTLADGDTIILTYQTVEGWY